jgi:hypothetical protein
LLLPLMRMLTGCAPESKRVRQPQRNSGWSVDQPFVPAQIVGRLPVMKRNRYEIF